VAVAVECNLRLVLDEQYRIVDVSPAAEPAFGALLGERFWDHFPTARPVFLPYCEEARRTGEQVEVVKFFEGKLKRVRYSPEGSRLVATWEVLASVDVSSLDTLQESLRNVIAALADEEPPEDRRPLLSVVQGGG
jgi:PAS domain-containing protein